MLWAIGAILLHFPAVPQAVVPATAGRPAASTAAMAVEAGQAQQAAPAAETVIVADASTSDNQTPFEPGRLVLTPVAAGSAPAAVASPAAVSPAIAPVIAVSSGRKPEFAGHVTDGQKRLWLGLTIAQHSAAAFDAWSTRRAITRGGAQELNPMLKPFANNGSIYAATQVAPLLLDLLSRRMMTSENTVLRHTWWLPQVLGTAASLAGGVHNLRVY